MKFCKYCQRDVNPVKGWSWVGFIFGFGIIYLIWYLAKTPHCPICHARMGFIDRDRGPVTQKNREATHNFESANNIRELDAKFSREKKD